MEFPDNNFNSAIFWRDPIPPMTDVKMKQYLVILFVACCVAASMSFNGDDKFIKKYAMMKVYESCFGADVLKEVRKEMKIATAKCSGLLPMSGPMKVHTYQQEQVQHQAMTTASLAKPAPSNSQIHNIQLLTQGGKPPVQPGEQVTSEQVQTPSHTFDLNKLQQVILSGYNKHLQQQSSLLPTSQQSQLLQTQHSPLLPTPQHSQPNQSPQFSPNQNLFSSPNQNQFTPNQNQFTTNQNQYQPYNINPAVPNHPVYPPVFYPNNIYPGNNIPQPYYPQASPYYQPQHPIYPPYYSRASRDLDIRGQLETLTNKMSGKVRNVTCVMQELGYLDENLEPDYVKMVERISRLPVPEDLKRDMADGVDYCKQFSQCVPEEKKDKIAREMVRPMFFFRCYKHKKLEACVLKDVREKYSPTDDMTEENLTGVGGEMRSLRNKRKKNIAEDDMMAAAVYEFLDGENTFDIDAII